MANRTTKAMMNRVFSSNEISQLSQLGQEIERAQGQADGLARTIAGALYVIQAKKLYEIESYKNIYEYAEQVHGISRGTCSDAINVFKRFGDPDNKRSLKAEYQNYAFRCLIMMKKLDDETIGRLRLTPETGSKETKQRIQDFTECQDKLPKDWTLETMHELLNAANAIEDKGEAEHAEKENTTDTGSIVEENAAIEKERKTEEIVARRNRAAEIMGTEAFNKMAKEEGENLDEAVDDYLDEFMTFPKRSINIKDMSDKDALKAIQNYLHGVRNGDFDLIITV